MSHLNKKWAYRYGRRVKKFCSSEKSLEVGTTGFDFGEHQLFIPCYGDKVTLKQNWHRKAQFLVDFTIPLLPHCPRSGTSIFFWPKKVGILAPASSSWTKIVVGTFIAFLLYAILYLKFKKFCQLQSKLLNMISFQRRLSLTIILLWVAVVQDSLVGIRTR